MDIPSNINNSSYQNNNIRQNHGNRWINDNNRGRIRGRGANNNVRGSNRGRGTLNNLRGSNRGRGFNSNNSNSNINNDEKNKKDLLKKIPKHLRRLDSLAWLIQGNDICGATYFDGEYIYLATNKNEESELIKFIKQKLSEIAKTCRVASNVSKNKKAKELKLYTKIEIKCYYIIQDMIKYADKAINIEIFKSNKSTKALFLRDFEEALNKIIYTIRHTFFMPEFHDNIEIAFANAIADNKFKFVITTLGEVHAELKILDEVIRNIENDSDSDKNYYIGVSKCCCRNCQKAMQAVNQVLNVSIKEKENKNNIITTRSSITNTDGSYFTSDWPKFLENTQYEAPFLKLVNKKTLLEAFRSPVQEYVAGSKQMNLKSEKSVDSQLDNILTEKTDSEEKSKIEKNIPLQENNSHSLDVSGEHKGLSNNMNLDQPMTRSDDDDEIVDDQETIEDYGETNHFKLFMLYHSKFTSHELKMAKNLLNEKLNISSEDKDVAPRRRTIIAPPKHQRVVPHDEYSDEQIENITVQSITNDRRFK